MWGLSSALFGVPVIDQEWTQQDQPLAGAVYLVTVQVWKKIGSKVLKDDSRHVILVENNAWKCMKMYEHVWTYHGNIIVFNPKKNHLELFLFVFSTCDDMWSFWESTFLSSCAHKPCAMPTLASCSSRNIRVLRTYAESHWGPKGIPKTMAFF